MINDVLVSLYLGHSSFHRLQCVHVFIFSSQASLFFKFYLGAGKSTCNTCCRLAERDAASEQTDRNPVTGAMSLIARGYESESEEEGEIEHGFVKQKVIQSKLRTLESSKSGDQTHVSKSQLESSRSGEISTRKHSSSDDVKDSQHHIRKNISHVKKKKTLSNINLESSNKMKRKNDTKK